MTPNETDKELKEKIEKLEKQLSKLKDTEKSLKRERDLNSEILHWTDSLVVVIDPKGYMVTFNRASEKVSGYRFEEVQSKPFWEILISDEEREGVKSAITNVVEKGLPEKFQNFWIAKDGSKRLVSWVNSVLRKPDGSIDYILCTGRDITEQKKSENALKQSESKYRELVEHANSIILRFDTRGRITFFNEFAQNFFGFMEDEILDQNVIGTILPQTESSGRDLKAMLDDMVRNPSQYVHNENENLKRDGTRVWIAWTNKAILDQNGKISEILSIGMDITDRRRTAGALTESEATLKSIFRAAPTGIGMVSNRILEQVNERLCEMVGYSSEELVGQSAKILYPSEEEFRWVGKEKYRQISKRGTGTVETHWKCKDGSIIDVLLSSSPIDSDNISAEVTFTALDITDRKHSEEEKLKLEAQLQKAQKMESIGTLAGGIAHDFNNILGAVIGFTELSIHQTEEGSELWENLNEVLKAGNRAKDLVRQILTFSRQVDQEQKPVQIKSIVKEALKLLRASLPTTIEILREISSDSLIMGDATQIHQVLMNLCTNAGHAMAQKGGVLEVTLSDVQLGEDFTARRPDMKPGDYIRLTASDTGHGMPQHVLDQIFDPFFTTKEKGEGTGMGLAVVHGIVKSHGGDIYAYSEQGKGSTFTIFFPAFKRRNEIENENREPIPSGSERILFVDDEPALADIGKLTLESLGYKVRTSNSSIEALELFRNQPDAYDLVITDMTMPKMTGDDLARELMTIRPDIPVILCTGYSSKIDERQAKMIGIRDFVLKPMLRRQIATAIRDVLDEKRQ
ncbi:related to two-component system sensory/regulatory protein (Ntr family) [Olavius algarvensis Delta 1 endosymbiont]|nr:related to two-component system sensory/regulatory protein (Ntr family) [Olavius algarvensis Delta 1 endosymbiont]